MDAAVSELASGTNYYAKWEGTTYKFVVGSNVFATFAEAAAASGDTGEFMLAPGSYTTLQVNAGHEVYGPNRKVDPSLRGAQAEDDWSKNPLWGKNGEAVVDNVMVTGEISLPVTVKGITLAGRFYDVERTTPGTLTVENILVDQPGVVEYLLDSNHESEIGSGNFDTYVFLLGNPAARTGLDADGGSSDQTALLKNIRFEGLYNSSLTSASSHRILAEYLPAHTTVEGFYLSSKYVSSDLFGYTKCGISNADTSLIIKDSYFYGLNASGQYFRLEGHNKEPLANSLSKL